MFVPQPKVIKREHKELKTLRGGLCAGHNLHSLSSVIATFPSVMRSTTFLSSSSFFSPLSDNMLCLLVLFHCFVLKLCVLYAQFITPGICCSEWHQPGNVTWQFIGQRNHYSFPFLSFCNRRCSLQKKAPSLFSGILLLCSHLTLTIAPITTQKCYRAYVGSTELNQEEGSDLV